MTQDIQMIVLHEALNSTYKEVFWTESEQAAVRAFLNKLPRVNTVKIVRCKNCVHVDKNGDCDIFDEWNTRTPDCYCCYAERKEPYK